MLDAERRLKDFVRVGKSLGLYREDEDYTHREYEFVNAAIEVQGGN